MLNLKLQEPFYIYIPLSLALVGSATYSAFSTGLFRTIAVFCIPTFCYPANPLSLVAISGVLLAIVPKWGWYSGFIAASMGVGYDLTGGGFASLFDYAQFQDAPVALIQTVILFLPAAVIRERLSFKPSKMLVAYLFIVSAKVWPPSVLPFHWFVLLEPVSILIFCFAYYRSLNIEQRR